MLILLGLGVLWMAVLLPPIIRHRNALGRPALTLVAAGRGSGRFDPTRLRSVGVAAAAVPVGVGSARRRRRDLLVALGGMAAFTFLAGIAVGGVVWMAHFLVDLVLVGYAVLSPSATSWRSSARLWSSRFAPAAPCWAGWEPPWQ